MKTNLKLAMILAANVAVLAGCSGGGGGGGSDSPKGSAAPIGNTDSVASLRDAPAAQIDSSNLEVLVSAATAGAAQAISGDSTSVPGVGIASLSQSEAITSGDMRSVAKQSSSVAMTERYAGSCGGEYRFEFPEDYFGGDYVAHVYYDNYCEGAGSYQFIYDGYQTIEADFYNSEQTSGKYFTRYDLTLRSNLETFSTTRIRGWQECQFDYHSDFYDCEEAHDYLTSSGRYYELSDAEVSGSAYEGYSVSARVADEEYGYITIEATDLIECETGGFSSGSLVITDASETEVVEILFSSCDSFTVTYEGVSETYYF